MRDDLKISEIEEQCNGQWVVVEITKRDRYRNPLRGRLLFNGSDQRKIYQNGRLYREAHPGAELYSFYAGDPIPQGIGVMFAKE
ncbi:hypothetical protein EDS67_27830 [candidate division KSB1 bacterium]|nr:MAG: hypothetical protein EDS67_27830 [candidate division KSB1 bacterium]MBC6949606.1 hypothetical protein [candidate division KSB1 bacterium]MCE7943560.1 hypothetical protein [Chlorobi bacterium CHB1]